VVFNILAHDVPTLIKTPTLEAVVVANIPRKGMGLHRAEEAEVVYMHSSQA
jgi:hypothetical protein